MSARRRWLALALTVAACARPEGRPPPSGVRVLSVAPQGAADTRPIEIHFERPIVDPAEATPVELELSPALPGVARFVSPSDLVFTPAAPLARATRYTLRLPLEIAGTPIVGERTFRFWTPLFEVRTVAASSDDERRVTVELSHPVDPLEADVAIRFVSGGQPVLAELESTEPSTRMIYRLPEESSPGELEVIVDAALAPHGGGDPLGKGVVRPVASGPRPLRVLGVEPVQVGLGHALALSFDADVEPKDLLSSLVIEPSVEVKVEPEHHGARLVGDFPPRSRVRLTLRRGLPSRAGGELEESIERTIEIGPLQPGLRIEASGATVFRPGPPAIELGAVNVRRVRLTVREVEPDVRFLPARHQGLGGAPPIGRIVLEDEVRLDARDDRWVSTLIPLGRLERGRRLPLSVEVVDADRPWLSDQKWLEPANLALVGRRSGRQVSIHVMRLTDGRPVAGARVSVLGRSRREAYSALTDGSGGASIELSSIDEELGIVSAEVGEDRAFLDASRLGAARAGPGASVVPSRSPVLPGEVFEVTAFGAGLPSRAGPYVIELLDPERRTVRRRELATAAEGLYVVSVEAPETARPGAFTLRLLEPSGRLLAQTPLEIGSLEPPPLEIAIVARDEPSAGVVEFALQPTAPLASGDKVNLLTKCSVHVVDVEPVDLGGFSFGSADGRELSVRDAVAELVLDDRGERRRACRLPLVPANRALLVSLDARSTGDERPWFGRGARVVHSPQGYLGVAVPRGGGRVDQALSAAVVVLDGRLQPVAGVKVELEVRQRRRRPPHGRERDDRVLLRTHATSRAGPVPVELRLDQPGRYVVIARARGIETEAELEVRGGGGLPKDAPPTIHLPASPPRTGEPLLAQIEVGTPGPVAVSVERERTLFHRWLDVSGSATVAIPLPAGQLHGAHVVVQALRPASTELGESGFVLGRAVAAIPGSGWSGDRPIGVELPSKGTAGAGLELSLSGLDRPVTLILHAAHAEQGLPSLDEPQGPAFVDSLHPEDRPAPERSTPSVRSALRMIVAPSPEGLARARFVAPARPGLYRLEGWLTDGARWARFDRILELAGRPPAELPRFLRPGDRLELPAGTEPTVAPPLVLWREGPRSVVAVPPSADPFPWGGVVELRLPDRLIGPAITVRPAPPSPSAAWFGRRAYAEKHPFGAASTARAELAWARVIATPQPDAALMPLAVDALTEPGSEPAIVAGRVLALVGVPAHLRAHVLPEVVSARLPEAIDRAVGDLTALAGRDGVDPSLGASALVLAHGLVEAWAAGAGVGIGVVEEVARRLGSRVAGARPARLAEVDREWAYGAYILARAGASGRAPLALAVDRLSSVLPLGDEMASSPPEVRAMLAAAFRAAGLSPRLLHGSIGAPRGDLPVGTLALTALALADADAPLSEQLAWIEALRRRLARDPSVRAPWERALAVQALGRIRTVGEVVPYWGSVLAGARSAQPFNSLKPASVELRGAEAAAGELDVRVTGAGQPWVAMWRSSAAADGGALDAGIAVERTLHDLAGRALPLDEELALDVGTKLIVSLTLRARTASVGLGLLEALPSGAELDRVRASLPGAGLEPSGIELVPGGLVATWPAGPGDRRLVYAIEVRHAGTFPWPSARAYDRAGLGLAGRTAERVVVMRPRSGS